MVRLTSNLLQPVLCDPSFHLTIALLNVRSLLAKLSDIRADNNLRYASIECFCEIWLKVPQPSPVLLSTKIDIRVICENKSGVLMSVSLAEWIHPIYIYGVYNKFHWSSLGYSSCSKCRQYSTNWCSIQITKCTPNNLDHCTIWIYLCVTHLEILMKTFYITKTHLLWGLWLIQVQTVSAVTDNTPGHTMCTI